MEDAEIEYLRQAVKNKNVYWLPGDDDCLLVKSVPIEMMDPDNIGIPEHIAILANGRGHLDLSGILAEHFVTMEPLFGKADDS